MEKSKVYFCKEITPENVVKIYQTLGKELPGKVAVKVHSGVEGNQNYLRPEFMIPMVKYVNGTIVECNAAYGGERNTTEKHKKLMKEHSQKGNTVFFSTHVLEVAEKLCDKIAVIDKGKIVYSGTPEDLKEKSKENSSLEEAFLKIIE